MTYRINCCFLMFIAYAIFTELIITNWNITDTGWVYKCDSAALVAAMVFKVCKGHGKDLSDYFRLLEMSHQN